MLCFASTIAAEQEDRVVETSGRETRNRGSGKANGGEMPSEPMSPNHLRLRVHLHFHFEWQTTVFGSIGGLTRSRASATWNFILTTELVLVSHHRDCQTFYWHVSSKATLLILKRCYIVFIAWVCSLARRSESRTHSIGTFGFPFGRVAATAQPVAFKAFVSRITLVPFGVS